MQARAAGMPRSTRNVSVLGAALLLLSGCASGIAGDPAGAAAAAGTIAEGGAAAAAGTLAAGGAPAAAGGAPASTGGARPFAGSSGQSGAPAAGQAGSAADCSVKNPGTAPLRRLSNAEYRHSLNDLFAALPGFTAVVAAATSKLTAEPESLGFRNNAQFLTVQPLLAQDYMAAAEAIASAAAARKELLPCTPVAGSELGCAQSFIAEFGKRAFRRPLSSAEQQRFAAQFQTALSGYGFQAGIEWVVYTVLQSAAFLYRVELGTAEPGAVTARPTPYETAARLSYLFWQSLPDPELLRAAEAGELTTPALIESQARRLLADPRSARLHQYFAEWLDLDKTEEMERDPAVFDGLPQNLPELFAEESRHFVEDLLRRDGASLEDLFAAPHTYVNAALAAHYGLPAPSGSGFVRVEAPHASGMLTQATLMVQDKPYRTSIVRRGLKVRTSLLCQNVPAPPDDAELNLEAIAGNLSQRERLEQHLKDPSCAGCHALLDPIGVLFENFDAVGRYRTVDEGGKPVDARTTIVATRDLDGAVGSVREFGARMAASSEVRDCYVTQTFRFFFGRDVEAADACSLALLRARFEASGYNVRELFVALTQTDAFLYRPLAGKVSQ